MEELQMELTASFHVEQECIGDIYMHFAIGYSPFGCLTSSLHNISVCAKHMLTGTLDFNG